tara:strand:+ start:17611 stop:17781 length:171 start_codon:yes stop_codon:yes gene_type:complete
MDVQAWRDNREALELERSLKDEAEKIDRVLNAENDIDTVSGSIPPELEDLSKIFDL